MVSRDRAWHPSSLPTIHSSTSKRKAVDERSSGNAQLLTCIWSCGHTETSAVNNDRTTRNYAGGYLPDTFAYLRENEWSGFLHTTTLMTCARIIVSPTFVTFLIFDQKWPLGKDYSLCVMANFSHFQNAFIFQKNRCLLEKFSVQKSSVLVKSFFPPFWHFPLWPFLAIFKMLSFFQY